MTEAARSVLHDIDGIVNDNKEPLKTLIANINTFSGVLAHNSDRVDGILAGLERMTGGGKAKSSATTIDLNPVPDISARLQKFRPANSCFRSRMSSAAFSTTRSPSSRRRETGRRHFRPSGRIL